MGTSLNSIGTNHDVFEVDVVGDVSQSLLPAFPVGGATYDAANDRVLFTSSSGSGDIDQLWEWPVGGALNNLGTITVAGDGSAQRIDGLAISDGVLYGAFAGATADDGIWTIDATTLEATLVFPFTDSVSGIDADPNTGAIYGANDSTGNLVLIDVAGQQMSPVASYPDGVLADIDGLAIGNDGRAYLITDEPGSFYVYNFAAAEYEEPLTAPWTSADTFSGGAYIGQTLPDLVFDPSSLDFGSVDTGTTSPPMSATLSNDGLVAATNLAFMLSGSGDFSADTSACGDTLPAQESCDVTVTFTPAAVGPANAVLEASSMEDVSASLELAGNGAGELFTPIALEVDPVTFVSDGNGIFEPNEMVDVAPAWRNNGIGVESLNGTASDFIGPAGPDYTIEAPDADYGAIDPAQTASCLDTEVCYRLGVDVPAERPATHWDATFNETLSDDTVKTWTQHIGDSFADVPRTGLFYPAIETLLHNGVSGDPQLARLDLLVLGCSETEFCPAAPNTRAQAAVLLLQGIAGGAFEPPPCVPDNELFNDVPADSPFCPWIQELAARGVTAGCGAGNYCPDASVTRAQMAVFLLKTLLGAQYEPKPCGGEFDDVTCPSTFADWIEDLFTRGFTAGCSATQALYCPGGAVTRGQMAALVVRTFELVIYGP